MHLHDDILVAAAIASRHAWEAAESLLSKEQLHDTAGRAWACIGDMYSEDASAAALSAELLQARLQAGAATDKLGQVYADYVRTLPQVSAPNVAATCRAIMQRRLRLSLVDKLLSGDEGVDAAIAEYQAATAIKVDEREPTQLTVDALCSSAAAKIRVHPKELNATLGGGLTRGDTVLIFGRPGSCKTAMTVNVTAGFAAQGLKVFYGCNEEAARVVTLRFLSLLGGVSLDDLKHADPSIVRPAISQAMERANARGMGNVHIVHGMNSFGDWIKRVREIEPDVAVMDQLRNVGGAGGYGGDMHSDMESVARAIRHHAVTLDYIGVMVAQAGASAIDKPVLSESDIDGVKTGLQGAVDVIAGVGVTEELRTSGKRMVSVCRNKVSGIIRAFPVQVDEQFTRIR